MKHTTERASQVPKDAIPGGVSYGRPGFASQDKIMPLEEIFDLATVAISWVSKHPMVNNIRFLSGKFKSSMKPNP